MENKPLVTVAVITYNSAGYVLETLESVKRQTYKNIELIVSDDNSKDDTVQLCKNWIEKNQGVFVKATLLTTDKNTGVSGNGNRSLKAANGSWYMGIAGDDILLDDAIESYVKYVTEEPKAKIVFGDYINFSGNFEDKKFENGYISLRHVCFGDNVSAKEQLKIISKMFVGYGPTLFIAMNVLREVGGFDETYPMQEDHALFLNVVKHGYKMYLMPKATVYYRYNELSISRSKDDHSLYNKCTVRYTTEYKYGFLRPCLSPFWRKMLDISLLTRGWVIKSGNNKKSIKCRVFYYLDKILNPITWYQRYMRIIDKLYV